MNLVLHSSKIDNYLKHDDVIDFKNEAVSKLADALFQKADGELDFIKTAYEFVRDNVSHLLLSFASCKSKIFLSAIARILPKL